MVYTAEHPALAVLEIMTAWNDYQDFSGYHLHRCEFDAAMVEDLVELVVSGSVDPTDRATTRAFGDLWIVERRSVALRVPSVVAPHSHNYLLNPAHPGFEDAVAREGLGPLRFDPASSSCSTRPSGSAEQDAKQDFTRPSRPSD